MVYVYVWTSGIYAKKSLICFFCCSRWMLSIWVFTLVCNLFHILFVWTWYKTSYIFITEKTFLNSWGRSVQGSLLTTECIMPRSKGTNPENQLMRRGCCKHSPLSSHLRKSGFNFFRKYPWALCAQKYPRYKIFEKRWRTFYNDICNQSYDRYSFIWTNLSYPSSSECISWHDWILKDYILSWIIWDQRIPPSINLTYHWRLSD